MSERFELIGTQGDINGHLRLRYGAGPREPASFVITLTAQYAARLLSQTPSVTFNEIEKYAHQNAGDLRAKALFERSQGFTTITLE
jgi:hypothetical protein